MVQIIILFFLLLTVPAEAVIFVPSPECPYTGHATCSDGIDNDADGTVDEAAPAAAFEADGDNYRANFSDCQAVTFATTADATFVSGDYVSKAGTVEHWRGEIACAGSFTNATYEVFLYYSLPIGPLFTWIKAGSTHGLVPDNAAATILSVQNTPAWANNTSALTKTGSLANAFTRTNSATALSFALNGAGALFIKSEGGLRLGCIYLRVVGDTTDPTCPGETGSGTPGHYQVYKLSGSAPTSCADAQFTAANTWNWIGSASTAETAPTLKLLHDSTRFYLCMTITDGDLRATTSANDTFPSNDDRFEFTWRDSTATTTRDATTFKFVFNPLQALYSANYPGNVATVSQSLGESCSFSLNGDIDLTADDTSYTIFCSLLAGFTLTDGMQIRGDVHVADVDGTGNTSRTGFGSAINSPSQWGVIDILATTVPGVEDETAPVVTSPDFPAGSVEESSAIMTAVTDEAGTCRVHYGTADGGPYTLQTAGSASVNGLCTEALGTGGAGSQTDPPLTAETHYYAVMKVTDASDNTGTSAQDDFTTDAAAPPTCTYYAGPTTAGAADGSSNANRFLIASFWPLATPGSSLCLADGTYQGANSMIVPTAGKKGTSLAPIKITGTSDGGALIDGQGARRPIRLPNDNDWIIIERINAKSSNESVIEILAGSDNVTIRRVVAWDAADANTCIFETHGANTLFEDTAGFGVARKIYCVSSSSNAKARRAWGSWTFSTRSDPKMTFTAAYNSTGFLCENCIGTWKEEGVSNTTGKHGIFANDQMQAGVGGVNKCTNARYLGSIAYRRTADAMASNYFGALQSSGSVDCMTYEQVVAYDQQTSARIAALNNLSATNGGPSNGNHLITRTTMIGGNTANIGNDWTQTSNSTGANVAAVPNIWDGAGTSGGRVCFRYQDGAITSTKLWPWPMDDRINAALTTSGRDPDDYFGTGNTLTDLMESIFGTIPAACKS